MGFEHSIGAKIAPKARENFAISPLYSSVAILEKNWNLGLPVLMFGRDFQRAETGSRKSFMAIQVGLPTHFEVHLRLRGHPDGDPAWKSIEDQLEVRELRQKRAFNTKETLFGEYESSRQTTCCFTRFYQNLNVMCCNDTVGYILRTDHISKKSHKSSFGRSKVLCQK